MAWVLKGLVRLYQLTLSPIFGGSCRFEPTCSTYAIEAIDRHGAWRGAGLAARRLLRCHPFGTAGFDPVPEYSGALEHPAKEGGRGHGH